MKIDKYIRVSMPPEIHQAIMEEARKRKMKYSETVRFIIQKKLNKDDENR